MKKIRLWKRDYEIIEDLRSGLYSASQLAKLYFSSHKKAAERLMLYFRAGLVGRFAKPLLDVRGKPEFVYCEKGKRQARSFSWINHALAVSDFRVWFLLGLKKCEGFGGLFLVGKGLPTEIDKGLVIPDFVFVLEKEGKKLLYLGEVDLGSESLLSCAGYGFGNKLDLYCDYFDSGTFNNDFGFLKYSFKGFRVATIFNSEERAKNFLKIAAEKHADFVLATTFQKLNNNPLLSKIWRTSSDELVDVVGKN